MDNHLSREPSNGQCPHVCIIGAGVSGLRCAEVLLQNSCKVTIIEARNRIGGRITQCDELGYPVDIGANWIHSTDSNPIVKLAAETGTPMHLWEQKSYVVDNLGKLVENHKADEALERVWRILKKASEYSAENVKTINPSLSLYDFFSSECDKLVHSGEIDEYERKLLVGMADMWGAYVGDRAERQSLKFFFLEDCIGGGDDLFIASNYRRIIEKIAELPLAKATMHFNKPMTLVHSDGSESACVTVVTADGKSQSFDEVVVTTPLGWLKQHKDAIKPLSPRLSKALDDVSFGRLEKVFIQFPYAYWDLPLSDTIGSDTASSPISFMHWLSPTYTPETNPSRWRLESVSFAALPFSHTSPTLLFYTFGDCSTYLTSLIAPLPLKSLERYTALDAFFLPYYSRLPNYDSETCRPKAYLATEWCNDEWAGNGSYSNFQIGMQDAAADVECMRYGMPENRIWLAGEHTASFDGLGTVSGAYFAGERVANRISRIYR